MFHTVITRKNLISLSLSVFYSLLLLFIGVCIDADSPGRRGRCADGYA